MQGLDSESAWLASSWRELVGVIFASGISAIGTSFAMYGTSKNFLIVSTSRLVLNILPGSVVASIVWNFGDYSLALSLVVFGIFLASVTGSVSYTGFFLGARLVPSRPILAGFGGAVFLMGGAVTLFTGLFVPAVAPTIAGGAAMALVLRRPVTGETDQTTDRRPFLKTFGAIAGFNVAAHVVGLLQGRGSERPGVDRERSSGAQQLQESADSRTLDVGGMPGYVVDTDAFYKVDINPRPPVVAVDDWSLTVTGAVESERTFGYDDIQSLETVHEIKTLRCLGDSRNGEQIGTAVWTGTPIMDLLAETEPQGTHLMLRAVDDYYYSMPIEMVQDGMVAYGMNGETLPRAHGFPARVLVPNRWGKLNVKWIEEIEVIDGLDSGYWEERGWDGMEPVNTVVKIQAANRLSDGAVQMGGHAYAGTRGIERVEISLDAGQTWSDATLAEPLPGSDTWRQWKYEWQPQESEYTIFARATDGTGTVQTRVRSDPYPSGATGWTRYSLSVDL